MRQRVRKKDGERDNQRNVLRTRWSSVCVTRCRIVETLHPAKPKKAALRPQRCRWSDFSRTLDSQSGYATSTLKGTFVIAPSGPYLTVAKLRLPGAHHRLRRTGKNSGVREWEQLLAQKFRSPLITYVRIRHLEPGVLRVVSRDRG